MKDTQTFERSDFDLGSFIRTHASKSWLFIICLGAFLAMAWLYNWYTNPEYEVSTKLMIQNEDSDTQSYFEELRLNPQNKLFENEIEVLRSHDLIKECLNRLEFGVTYHLVGNYKTSEVYKSCPFSLSVDSLSYEAHFRTFDIRIDDSDGGTFILNEKSSDHQKFAWGERLTLPFGNVLIEKRPIFDDSLFDDPEYSKRKFRVKFNTIDQSKNSILSRLRIDMAREGSTILRISLQDEVPLKAMDFLNTLTSVYLENNNLRKNNAATLTSEFIDEQLAVISSELNEIELDKQNYKVSQGIVDLNAESRLLMENAIDVDRKISDIEAQINKIEHLERYIVSSGVLSDLAPSALDLNDPLLVRLISKLNDLEDHRRELIFSTKEGSTLLANVDLQIERTKDAITENAKNIRQNINEELLALSDQRKQLNRKIGSIPGRERELVNIERQFRIKESLFTYLLEKQAEVSISLASNSGQSRVVDKAITTPGPIRPQPKRAYSIAILLGLLLPFIFFYIKEKMKDTVSGRKTVQKHTQVPIIGLVGNVDAKSAFVMIDKPRSAVAESFRTIRTNLKYFTGEGNQKVILVTSSVGSEGKTFCALNIAASLALAGSKTIVIGMDMRKPRLGKSIGVDRSIGLSSYLIGVSDLNEVVESTEVENLDMLPAGHIPPNPSELIMRPRMSELLSSLRNTYDHIVIDSPPVGLVTDGFLLAKYSDAVIYVIRQKVTKKAHLNILDELHKGNKLPNLSILLNDVKKKDSSYGGYGNTYGYGYFEEDDLSKARTIINKTKELLRES